MLAFLLGAIIGSFLNVIIIRTPKKLSIITPRSHCPKCNKTLPFYLNIPIVSYIFLKGKCYFCKSTISIQYFIVELLTAIVFMIYFFNFSLEKAFLLSFVSSVLIVIGFIDLKCYLIPTYLIILLYISLVPKIILYNVNGLDAIIGSLSVGLYLISCSAIIIIRKRTLSIVGLGDILLAFFIGAWLELFNGLFCLFIASIIGIFFILIKRISKKESRENKIPFGTCISISFLIVIILEIYCGFNLFTF